MMTLIRFLPLALGKYVPDDDEHWACFLIFWDICNLALAFRIRDTDSGNMAWMVELYLDLFSTLYSEEASFIPKLHQLVHLPEQMLRFGPLRSTWCMRFEAKNKELKSFVTNCHKNIPYSVACRHQINLCYLLSSRSFLYAGDEVHGGNFLLQWGLTIHKKITASPIHTLSIN
jgi:hypothetical protein